MWGTWDEGAFVLDKETGYFADPDGHLWELAHNPFMQLDGQGHMTLPD